MLDNYKKAMINNRVVTVISPQEVLSNQAFQNKFTAVEIDNTILPVKNSYDPASPGFYIIGNGKIGKIVKPSEEDKDEYSSEHAIDFSDIKSMKELIAKQEQVKRLEADTLSNSDNLFKPIVKDNDSPEMKAMKQALNLKNIDIDAYADRFGDNFNNEKRLLKGSSITMSKLKSIGDKLDMKITLVITDSNPNVPNPIGDTISVDICGYGEDNYDDEE